MGMFTALHFNAELKSSTPPGVVRILRVMTSEDDRTPEDRLALPDHPLFGDTRWRYMLTGDSYYFEAETHSHVVEYPDGYNYGLSVTCNFKNYDHELSLFLDWIMPYVDAKPGDWLGYHMYENDDLPTLICYPGGAS